MTKTNFRTPVRLMGMFTAAALAAALSSGCDARAGGTIGQLQDLAKTCPAEPLATTVHLDGSGSRDGETMTAEDLRVVRDQAQYTAVCGGTFRVVLFATNASETTILADTTLRMSGATEIARLRRVAAATGEVADQVEAAFPQALAALPRDGSDIMSQFGLMSEYVAQVDARTGVKHRLNGVVVTDGVATVPDLSDPGLTVEQAEEIAANIVPPDLSEASITVAGVGRTSGGQMATETIDALKALYVSVLGRTNAEDIVVVTDYVTVGDADA